MQACPGAPMERTSMAAPYFLQIPRPSVVVHTAARD
jgi:hypothetical protein